MVSAGRCESWVVVDGSTVRFEFERGVMEISSHAKGIFRVRFGRSCPLREYRSLSVVGSARPVELEVRELEGGVEVGDGMLRVVVKDGGAASWYRSEVFLWESEGVFRDVEWMEDRHRLGPEDEVFGLGEQMTPLSRRGYVIENWNTDANFPHTEASRPMYCSIPFMLGGRLGGGPWWGYFLDSPYRSLFDVGNADPERLTVRLFRDDLTVYVMSGDAPHEVLSLYTGLTGRHEVPPLWSLGYQQCKYSYMSEEEALGVARRFRELDIPCDGLWYDIDYMDGYRVFTFDRGRFPNPAEHFRAVKELGFRPVVIVDPGLKADSPGVYPAVDEGSERGFFLRRPDGSEFEGRVWPGLVKFPDFSREEVRSWWAGLHRVYFEAGVEGIWNDMNEPALLSDHVFESKTVPEEVRMYDEGRWSGQDRMHNLYALLEAMATREAFERFRPGRRPFLLTRAGFAGIQRYAAVWTGDNRSTWEHLRMSIPQILNMGLSGVGFVGADVGGFGENVTPELLVRWYQLGAFYPFFRGHNAKGFVPQEPFAFDGSVTDLCREAIRLRYRLLPYVYERFHEMAATGAPVWRPLFWYDRSPDALRNDEFFLGGDLVVAPALERGMRRRMVYLPPGEWFHYHTHERWASGYSIVETPIDNIPVFVRAGAVIPVYPSAMAHTGEREVRVLSLEVWPDGEAEGVFHEDDGETPAPALVHRFTRDRNRLIIHWEAGTRFEEVRVLLPLPGGAWRSLSVPVRGGRTEIDLDEG
ncbi:glycoside hydrolase family 31 [Spirochaeta thermophila DSM 6578]|uniref:Glycoside hydrolase family 31 n=1 Tax=Winmispira thermophila (strain ATCC 700085 / DSM 6578 / Z-1203) TaxID=869211 RepID=G0GDG9_WINT7|nr:TIM-barrel domain-containing protein [Spirochaeta thermophila]AEJ61316.1 glycoside hydrolase family 31 [Spirochaeta thermophila DSM 6578]